MVIQLICASKLRWSARGVRPLPPLCFDSIFMYFHVFSKLSLIFLHFWRPSQYEYSFHFLGLLFDVRVLRTGSALLSRFDSFPFSIFFNLFQSFSDDLSPTSRTREMNIAILTLIVFCCYMPLLPVKKSQHLCIAAYGNIPFPHRLKRNAAETVSPGRILPPLPTADS